MERAGDIRVHFHGKFSWHPLMVMLLLETRVDGLSEQILSLHLLRVFLSVTF